MPECRQVTRFVPIVQIFFVPSVLKAPSLEKLVLQWIKDLEQFKKLYMTFLLAELDVTKGLAQVSRIYRLEAIQENQLQFLDQMDNLEKISGPGFPSKWTMLIDFFENSRNLFENIMEGPMPLLPFNRDQLNEPHVSAHIWIEIMSNRSRFFSLGYARYEDSFSGASVFIFGKRVNDAEPLHRPMYIPATLESFRFITCGYRETAGMAFEELVSVYELEVWIWLGVTMTVVVLSWKCLMWLVWKLNVVCKIRQGQQSARSSSGLFSLLKILLEQGDPFPADM